MSPNYKSIVERTARKYKIKVHYTKFKHPAVAFAHPVTRDIFIPSPNKNNLFVAFHEIAHCINCNKKQALKEEKLIDKKAEKLLLKEGYYLKVKKDAGWKKR